MHRDSCRAQSRQKKSMSPSSSICDVSAYLCELGGVDVELRERTRGSNQENERRRNERSEHSGS